MNSYSHFAFKLPARARFGFYSILTIACLLACFTKAQAQVWSQTGSLGMPRSLHTATTLANGKVLVAGGMISSSPCCTGTNTAEIYDPATGQWSATGSMSEVRSNHIAIRLPNGKVMVAGGNAVGNKEPSNTVEVYDPVNGTWSQNGLTAATRNSMQAVLQADGKVIIAGGISWPTRPDIPGPIFTTAGETYDPVLAYGSPNPMNTGHAHHTLTLLPNGKTLLAGGIDPNQLDPVRRSYSAELYDTTSRWQLTGRMLISRLNHTAILLPSGKVLVAGGRNIDNLGFLPDAELYDPATKEWSPTGAMDTPRAYHTMTLLPNGKVLVVGGASARGMLKSAEVYDPATGAWSPAGNLSLARQDHRAALLADGRVMISGGNGTELLTSVEIFDSSTPTTATVSAASYSLQTAAKEIVTAFGQNLSTTIALATTLPLPISLGGTSVRILDAQGIEHLAPLFFVSPNQINYQIPGGIVAGQAMVSVTASDGRVTKGVIQVLSSAPSIFTLNATGKGPAAAVDALTGVGAPFNAKRATGEPNIITFFSTGLGGDATDVDANISESVQANIDGNPINVLYAGRAPGFVGLNQLNLVLPAGISSGEHSLTIIRNGVVGNSVTISIK
ncbi:MAG: kelch repeat-containing protein [Acidobacteriota bacterium]